MFKYVISSALVLLFAVPATATLSPEVVGIIAKGLQRSKKGQVAKQVLQGREDIQALIKTQVGKVPAELRSMKSLTADEVAELNAGLGDIAHTKWVSENSSRGVNFKKMTTDSAGSVISTEEQLLAFFKTNNVPEKFQVKNADGTYKFYKKGVKKDGSPDATVGFYSEDLLGVNVNRFLSRVNRDNNEIAAVALVSFTQQWLAKGGKIDEAYFAAAAEVNHNVYMHTNSYLAKDANGVKNPDWVPFHELPAPRADLDITPVTTVFTSLQKIRADKLAAASIKETGNRLKNVNTPTAN